MLSISGGYQHSIDPKGRIFFPTRLKEKMGEALILCRGVEKCLMAFSEEGWEQFDQSLRSLPFSSGRDIQRFFFSTVAECAIDRQGRLLIPQDLRDHAGLKSTVKIMGVQTRVEIWDLEEWESYHSNLSPKDIIAQMDKIGF
jgi:MraZ protein